jgi:hypothetical protein
MDIRRLGAAVQPGRPLVKPVLERSDNRGVSRRRRARAAIAAAALCAAGASAAPSSALGFPAIGGCEAFPGFDGAAGSPSAPDQSAWNQDVSQTPKDPRSARYMRRIRELGGNQRLHPDFGGDGEYGIPYLVVPESEPLVDVTIGPQGYPDESEFGTNTAGPPSAPIPLDAPVEGGGGGGDRHVLAVREGTCELFEMYRSFPQASSWRADSTALFDLAEADRHPEGWTSADAAGLPILPGLVRYDEVAAGSVEHAIRATFERTRRGYIHPATHYASSACGRSLPPMGLRLRLRRGYYEGHLDELEPGSQARPIFEALYRYGLIVADNGSNFFFTGASDPGWDDDDLGRLKDVPGRAFLVVDAQAGVTTPC